MNIKLSLKNIVSFLILISMLVICLPVTDSLVNGDFISITYPVNFQSLCVGTKASIRYNFNYNPLFGPLLFEISNNGSAASNWIELPYSPLEYASVAGGLFSFEIKDSYLGTRFIRVRPKFNKNVISTVIVNITKNPVLFPASWIDNNDLGSRKPLIFVHGIGLSIIRDAIPIHLKPEEASWDNLLKFLQLTGIFNQYKPYIFMYDSNDTDDSMPNEDSDGVIQVSHKLAIAISNDPILKNNKLTFIAHSMGGLVTRSLMEFWSINSKPAGEVVDKVITLFTPHRGSPLTNFPPNNLYSLTTLKTNSKFINDISWDTNYKPFPLPMRSELNQVIFNNNFLLLLNNIHTYDSKIIPYYGTNNDLATPFIDLGIRDIIKNQWSKIKIYSELDKNDAIYFGNNDGVVPELSGKGEGLFNNSISFSNCDHIGWTNGPDGYANLYYQIVNDLLSSSSNGNGGSSTSPSKPSEPLKLSVTLSNGKPYLTWSAPISDGGSPILKYFIYRGTSSGNHPDQMGGWQQLSYYNTTASEGTTYYYVVTALNSIGESAFSNEVSIYVPSTSGGGDGTTPCKDVPTTPGKPTANMNCSTKALSFNWSASSVSTGCCSVTNYLVGYTSNGMAEQIFDAKTSTSIIFNSAADGTTYCIRVKAKNCNGESGWSEYTCYTVGCKNQKSVPIPYFPSDQSVVYTNSPTLKWNCDSPLSNLKGYEIVVCSNSECNENNYIDKITTTKMFWEPSKISYGKLYYWKVRCVTNDTPQQYSDWSLVYSFKVEQKPPDIIVTSASVIFHQNSYDGELPLYDCASIDGFGFFGFEVNEECLVSIEVYKDQVVIGSPFWKSDQEVRMYPNHNAYWNTITPTLKLPSGSYWWRYKARSVSNKEQNWTWVNMQRNTTSAHFVLLDYIPDADHLVWNVQPYGTKYNMFGVPADKNNTSLKNAKVYWNVDIGTIEYITIDNTKLDKSIYYIPSGNDYYATFSCYVDYRGSKYGPFTYKLKIGNPRAFMFGNNKICLLNWSFCQHHTINMYDIIAI